MVSPCYAVFLEAVQNMIDYQRSQDGSVLASYPHGGQPKRDRPGPRGLLSLAELGILQIAETQATRSGDEDEDV